MDKTQDQFAVNADAGPQVAAGRVRRWYRRSPVARRYLVPFLGTVTALLVPLIYEVGLFSEDTRFLVYITLALVAGIATVTYRNLEFGEEEFQRQRAEWAIQEQANLDLSLREQVRLGHHLRAIVREKSERFVQAIRQFEGAPSTARKHRVFEVITQPEIQIALVLEHLGRFFEFDREHRVIEVVLLRPNLDQNAFEYVASYPKDAKPNWTGNGFDLRTGVCGRSLDLSSMVVVEDIAKDLASANPVYHPLPNSSGRGAIFCCPVFDGQRSQTAFVLSVYISEPRAFLESEAEYLEEIVGPFKTRLLLEERLRVLKNLSS